nr:hypothetical protein [Cohaesibacter marisflavi]
MGLQNPFGHELRDTLRRDACQAASRVHGLAEFIKDRPLNRTNAAALGVGIVTFTMVASLGVDDKLTEPNADRL